MNFSLETFCTEAATLLQIVGWFVTIIKVGMPLVIVIYGVLDFGKAVVASKEDEIKTSAKRLMWRAVAGICIFFVPTIVMWLFGTISDFNEATGAGFDNCKGCILSPWDGASCSTSE